MSKPFAKLFETEEHGQILVVLEPNEESCPSVKFSFKPEGLGICSIALAADDTEKGWSAMEEAFEAQTQETAIKVVDEAMKDLNGFLLAGGIEQDSKEPV